MKNFIVYKITGKHTNKIYYGKTSLPVKKRLSLHLSAYRFYKESYGLSSYFSVFDIFRESNDLKSDIEITILTPGLSNYNAAAIEDHYIQRDKNCCNKNRSGFTTSNMKEYQKDYWEKHKNKINKMRREKYAQNKKSCVH